MEKKETEKSPGIRTFFYADFSVSQPGFRDCFPVSPAAGSALYGTVSGSSWESSVRSL